MGDAKGSRVLVKCYSARANNELLAARAAESVEASAEARMRLRLEGAISGSADTDVPERRLDSSPRPPSVLHDRTQLRVACWLGARSDAHERLP